MRTPLRPRRGVGRSAFALAGTIVLASIVSAGCSEQGSAEQLNANSPVAITTHQTVVRVQNKAGLPLMDIKLTVVPYGNTEFSRLLSRMENMESREIGLNELASRDGTVFNLRLSKPKLVRLSATDATGKHYDVEVPWR